jgi:hypothetical protein
MANPPRRFIRAVGVINPRERTAADPHDSNLMTKSDMKRAAKYLAGKPIKFYHDSQVLGSSKEFALGKVLECFENDGRLLCHFEINRDENNPIEFFTGSQVLQGLLNGLSASTRALKNKDTGDIITNCADPSWLKATGSSNTDPGLEVSLCSRDDAARGTGCAILYATEWQKNTDGTVQHLGNVFQPEQQKVNDLLSSDADIYKHCAEQAIGEKSSSSILAGHSSFEPLVVQACKERKKISANGMSNPENPSSSSSSSSSPSGTPTPPASAPTPSPPTATATTDESRKRSETVDAFGKDDNHKDKRPATEDKRSSSDDAQDSTAALMARLEYLEKAHAEAIALQKKTEEDAKRQQFEQKRAQLKSVIESVIDDYQKMLEEGGKNPEEDKFFMSFKNVDKVDTETQLGHLGNAVELTQACTLPWRQARMRLEEIQKREKEDSESQRRREERQRKIEEARLKIAETNAQNSRASFVQPPSSGGYQDPFAALAGLSRNADLNRMSNVPQADSMAKMVVDQQQQQQQQQNAPSQTPEDPRMKFFEKTPSGSWALKPPQIIAPCYSTDRCLASTPGTLCQDTPSTLMSRSTVYAGAVPTSYDHGMQGRNPARFMEILQSCVSQPPSGIPERIPEYMLRNMLFPRAPVS